MNVLIRYNNCDSSAALRQPHYHVHQISSSSTTMSGRRLPTVFDFSALRLHPDGRRVKQNQSARGIDLDHAPNVVFSRGHVGVPKRVKVRDEDAIPRLGKGKGKGKLVDGLEPEDEEDVRPRKKRRDIRPARRRDFLQDLSFLDEYTNLSQPSSRSISRHVSPDPSGSRSATNTPAPTQHAAPHPIGPSDLPLPSSDLLKCIHHFASTYYTEHGEMLQIAQQYRKEKKERQHSTEPTRKKKRLDEDLDDDHEEHSSSGNKEEGTSRKPAPRKRRPKVYRDMYKMFDGTALMAIGMLVQGYVESMLTPKVPPNWERDVRLTWAPGNDTQKTEWEEQVERRGKRRGRRGSMMIMSILGLWWMGWMLLLGIGRSLSVRGPVIWRGKKKKKRKRKRRRRKEKKRGGEEENGEEGHGSSLEEGDEDEDSPVDTGTSKGKGKEKAMRTHKDTRKLDPTGNTTSTEQNQRGKKRRKSRVKKSAEVVVSSDSEAPSSSRPLQDYLALGASTAVTALPGHAIPSVSQATGSHDAMGDSGTGILVVAPLTPFRSRSRSRKRKGSNLDSAQVVIAEAPIADGAAAVTLSGAVDDCSTRDGLDSEVAVDVGAGVLGSYSWRLGRGDVATSEERGMVDDVGEDPGVLRTTSKPRKKRRIGSFQAGDAVSAVKDGLQPSIEAAGASTPKSRKNHEEASEAAADESTSSSATSLPSSKKSKVTSSQAASSSNVLGDAPQVTPRTSLGDVTSAPVSSTRSSKNRKVTFSQEASSAQEAQVEGSSVVQDAPAEGARRPLRANRKTTKYTR
ncbi:hypothetical protein BDQ17DRAFT_1354913 [Cyathus striatus]|nr:hypothetical protein BDQ17DRAFT_1354913 [Cyathus striatus]